MFKLKYKFISTIRRGSFGTVDLYRMRFSRKFYAVKNIRNCNFNKNEVICFNCGNIGHYANQCYVDSGESDESYYSDDY